MTIHHITWRNHIDACLCIAECNAVQIGQRFIIHHISLGIENAAMTVVGIFTHAHIPNHIDFRCIRLDKANRPLYDTILCIRLSATGILMIRNTEQDTGQNLRSSHFIQSLTQTINGIMINPGQCFNFPAYIFAFHNKQWIYQISFRQYRFLHHGTDNLVFSQSSSSIHVLPPL